MRIHCIFRGCFVAKWDAPLRNTDKGCEPYPETVALLTVIDPALMGKRGICPFATANEIGCAAKEEKSKNPSDTGVCITRGREGPGDARQISMFP